MTDVIIKARRPVHANFICIDIPGQDGKSISIDVGVAFADDMRAEEYWDELKESWVEHVRQRRLQLGKGVTP